MHPFRFYALCFFVGAMPLLPASALSETVANSNDQVQRLSRDPLHLVQQRQCSQRLGPYATQDTAWQRWREANSQGYAVSNGVVPCYDGYGTRGYCFFIFYAC